MGATVTIERRRDPNAELGYVCPECKAWSSVTLWKDTEVLCDECGTHGAIRCPLCEEDVDTVFNDFEDPDRFSQDAERNAGPSLIEQLAISQAFLSSADARFRTLQDEANAFQRKKESAKREADTIQSAWLHAVGDRLLFRPDLGTALFETTLDMRLHLDEFANEDAVYLHAEIVGKYGPYTPRPIEEDA
ncbi:hypothetical protein MKK64_23710 [Methylobacterium sp. E-025]|jgi:uncharacterized Zn finger protein (UPF0148 family)|uniref:hypothetical protein n=1 Tax=Methylobacterium sp. E-025 TaxID=2836561 RepID=UPI001FBB6BE3|nr:hypothetical protein [Methylobacterium sp. E-025]MCJ2114179.1 hypothetical protein [Methylobacterium sp. E-025]